MIPRLALAASVESRTFLLFQDLSLGDGRKLCYHTGFDLEEVPCRSQDVIDDARSIL